MGETTVTAAAPVQRAAYGSQGQGPLSPTVQGDTAQAGRPSPTVLLSAQESLRTSRALLLLCYSKKKTIVTACHKTEQAVSHLPLSLTTITRLAQAEPHTCRMAFRDTK